MSDSRVFTLSIDELEDPFSVYESGTIATVRDYILAFGSPATRSRFYVVESPPAAIKPVTQLSRDELRTIAEQVLMGKSDDEAVAFADVRTTRGVLLVSLFKGTELGARFLDHLAGVQIVLDQAIRSGSAALADLPPPIRAGEPIEQLDAALC